MAEAVKLSIMVLIFGLIFLVYHEHPLPYESMLEKCFLILIIGIYHRIEFITPSYQSASQKSYLPAVNSLG